MSFFNESANAIRFLSIDAVECAQSGHPGMPLGMADIATVLWQKHLKHHPQNPRWFNRDRFVLSNGHGSMLLYSLLHLTGYALTIEDLKQFRQLHSKTPGHPEMTDTPGVETTTGPLGQGLANAVGMAIAEKNLSQRFNREGLELVDHHTYAFVGDGCLMEGISHEVCSLAGTLGLNKLIVFYDDNGISIDGKVDGWFSDNTPLRFKAYHWHVIEGIDGHDSEAIDKAIIKAKQQTEKPTLIICKTTIGYGSPQANSEKSHGSPLGAVGIAKTREAFHWPYAPFEIPDHIYQVWNHNEQGMAEEASWLKLAHQYQEQFSDDYHDFLRQINGDLPSNWSDICNSLISKAQPHDKPIATRKASQFVLEHFGPRVPELLGGSADLTGSNNTDWSGSKMLTRDDFSGNYIHYGVREFGMAAIMNGLALHGGFIPYGGTFLVFADYARNAIRLSAIMKQRVIYVLTHDSIGLGEDGPTHQPIEQATMLRVTPGMHVWRPASLLETAIAWKNAIERFDGPSCLLLSRQNLPPITHSVNDASNIQRGGYIVSEAQAPIKAIIIATGSEVSLALDIQARALTNGINVRVVSMPCCELFLAQDSDYKEQILPANITKRLAIEAGSTAYWAQFTGLGGYCLGIDRFGVSAPIQDAYRALGLTAETGYQALLTLLSSEN